MNPKQGGETERCGPGEGQEPGGGSGTQGNPDNDGEEAMDNGQPVWKIRLAAVVDEVEGAALAAVGGEDAAQYSNV